MHPIVHRLRYTSFDADNGYFPWFSQMLVFPLEYEHMDTGVMDWIKVLIDRQKYRDFLGEAFAYQSALRYVET